MVWEPKRVKPLFAIRRLKQYPSRAEQQQVNILLLLPHRCSRNYLLNSEEKTRTSFSLIVILIKCLPLPCAHHLPIKDKSVFAARAFWLKKVSMKNSKRLL